MEALSVFKVFVVLVHLSVAVTTSLRGGLFGLRQGPPPSVRPPGDPTGSLKNQMILCGLCRIKTEENLTECDRLCLSSVKGHDWPGSSSQKLMPSAPSNKAQPSWNNFPQLPTQTKLKNDTNIFKSFSLLSSATSRTPIALQNKNGTDVS